MVLARYSYCLLVSDAGSVWVIVLLYSDRLIMLVLAFCLLCFIGVC